MKINMRLICFYYKCYTRRSGVYEPVLFLPTQKGFFRHQPSFLDTTRYFAAGRSWAPLPPRFRSPSALWWSQRCRAPGATRQTWEVVRQPETTVRSVLREDSTKDSDHILVAPCKAETGVLNLWFVRHSWIRFCHKNRLQTWLAPKQTCHVGNI